MYNLDIPGFMTEQDLNVISDIASTVPENGIIVELGSFKGKSTVAWASNCDPSVSIYCIDRFKSLDDKVNFFEEFKENTKSFKNVNAIVGWSPHMINFPDIKIDVFFLDAFHANPNDWYNIEYFLPKIKPGGLLCGHDYLESFPDVIKNVRRLEQMLDQEVTLYPGTSLYSFRI